MPTKETSRRAPSRAARLAASRFSLRRRATSFAAPLALVAALLAAGAAAADPIAVGEEHCVVNVRSDDVLNMREAPNANSYVVAQKRHNACGIRVNAECAGNWCAVEDGHSLGFVHRRYIAMVSPALYCVDGVAPGDVLNMRAFPSAQSRVIHRLAPNACDIAFLPYAVGGWQKVRAESYEGWVSRRYLSGQ